MKSKWLMFVFIGLLATVLIAGCGPADDDDDAVNGVDLETHTIVGLFPLTGVLSTFGENSSTVAQLAAEDVNEWLEAEGKDWRLRLEIDDTQTEGPVGLRKMQSWFGDGVKFFAGPQGSGVAQECLGFANSNQILFISPSSTSPALGIADDWLFRFCTDDLVQGPAIAAVAAAAGVEHIIFSWQGDTWGDGLQSAAAGSMAGKGITIYPRELRFDPQKEDFTTDAALLDEYVTDLVEQGVALETIGVNLITFEQAAPYLAEAARYPQLSEVVWIGSDGTAVSEAILQHPVASVFAVDVKFVNSMNRPAEETVESNKDRVRDHVQQVLGRDTDAYSYNTYDIIWAMALSIDEVGYDTVAVREILPRVTDEWSQIYGASGHVVLNEAGDRAFADYDYWVLNESKTWEIVGYFEGATDNINWTREIY